MRRRELLSSNKANDGRDVYNNYEYVDLQLTGSAANLMWATWNVGASSETEYGNYYQWGAGSIQYADANQYHTGGTNKYYTLPMSADTARQVMGGDWRMPTCNELKALTAQTTYQWVTNFNGSGVNGGKFSKTIDGVKRYVFFPAAGSYGSGSLNGKNEEGLVWSSTPYNSSSAYNLDFYIIFNSIDGYSGRVFGFSVRGVFTNNI